MEDYIDIDEVKYTIKQLFKKKIDSEQAIATKNRTLFDYRCAKLDFEDMIERKNKELERNEKKSQDINRKIVEEFDLKPYKDMKRFKLISVTDSNEDIIISGTKKKIKTGEWEKYVCKERGCGIEILKPYEEKKI